MTTQEHDDELIRALERDHAVLIVRVDHHDSRITEMLEEQQWLRRLLITSMFIVVMTFATAVLGVALAV